ncbi:MAG TPA: DUF406 family protein [Proteus sp.]|uniref:DUF406 family protein n=1 Tax=Proteus hauseri ATCC 700826 TaxID=1354271 RepID=A0AAJ3HQZ1_PROHU|nr:YfcZ/YiiS family protein [Proteus hauseri]OAT45784.1 hypothetical protein M997_2586 [Proteus hauseri ATCC 700826]QAV21970.1 DUF406 domain-containing protein [Proteus hauseri]HCH49666.1 DUF406 family protein [Proteus sp. (in: enterobacteria)]
MANAINRCSAEETAACCCVDVGTIIDNKNCTASYEHIFSDKAQAEAMLEQLSAKARSIASEPCQITHKISEVDGGIQLVADFTFSCEAENLIFQLGLR